MTKSLINSYIAMYLVLIVIAILNYQHLAIAVVDLKFSEGRENFGSVSLKQGVRESQ